MCELPETGTEFVYRGTSGISFDEYDGGLDAVGREDGRYGGDGSGSGGVLVLCRRWAVALVCAGGLESNSDAEDLSAGEER